MTEESSCSEPGEQATAKTTAEPESSAQVAQDLYAKAPPYLPQKKY